MHNKVYEPIDKSGSKFVPINVSLPPGLTSTSGQKLHRTYRSPKAKPKRHLRKRFITFFCFFAFLANAFPVHTCAQDNSGFFNTDTRSLDFKPYSAPESKRKDAITYLFLFQQITELEKSEKAEVLLRKTGLSPQSAENLRGKAAALDKEIKLLDEKASAVIDEYRGKFPSNKLPKGTELPPPPQELFSLQAEKDNTVLKYRDSLKSELGEDEFAKLSEYIGRNVSGKVIQKTGGDAKQDLENKTPENSIPRSSGPSNSDADQYVTEPETNSVSAPAPAPPMIPDPNTYYQVVSALSGKCADVIGGQAATSNAIGLQQFSCVGQSQTNQLWKFVPMGGDIYQVVAQHSDKCMDVSSVSYSNGAGIQQFDCIGSTATNQLWQLVPIGNSFQLIAQHSNKCLDVTGGAGSLYDGASLQQWDCVGATATNQLWILRLPPPPQNEPNVYNYSSAIYDDSTNTVYGYASTLLDYGVALFYTPRIQATLKNRQGSILAFSSNTGSSTAASVTLVAAGQGGQCDDYLVESIHELIAVFIYVIEETETYYYYEWYDPYDFYYYSSYPGYYEGFRAVDPWVFSTTRTIVVETFVVALTEFLTQPSVCADSNISSVEYQQIGGAIDDNPGNGVAGTNVGKRIYPDKETPTDMTDRTKVRVKATLTNQVAGVRVYFKTFDPDDPSADNAPIDPNGNEGNDNRGKVSNHAEGELSAVSALTDANGVAFVDLTVTKQPGDNFAVAATKDRTYLDSSVVPDGVNIKKGSQIIPISGGTTPPATVSNPAMRTEMLTVWRKLHMEVDDMGIVVNDPPVTGTLAQPLTVRNGVDIYQFLPLNLEKGRYSNSKIYFSNGSVFSVRYSDSNGEISLNNTGAGVTLPAGTTYTLYDDDDFNSNDGTSTKPLHGDNGEDVTGNDQIFKSFQDADGINTDDGSPKNVYAAAFIKPEYAWAQNYKDTNVPFSLYVEFGNLAQQTNAQSVLDTYRGTKGMESNDFWIGYVLIGYQGPKAQDCDNDSAACIGGVGFGYTTDTVTNSSQVPAGAYGAFVFIESVYDGYRTGSASTPFLIRVVVPHEVGHEFGISGDSYSNQWGIMGYPNSGVNYNFHPEHINLMRWRIPSPGKQ